MRLRIVLLVVLSLAFAGLAAFFVLNRMNAAVPPQPAVVAAAPSQVQAPTSTTILVAARYLPTGTLISEGDVRAQAWPSNLVPPTAFLPGTIIFGETVVRVPVAADTPVLSDQIVKKGSGGYMTYVLSQGRVALTLPLTDTSSIAGHLTPGDFVDVLFTHVIPVPGGQGDLTAAVTERLLQRVKVLAVDLTMDDSNPEKSIGRNATLELSPKEAEILTLAGQTGTLTFALNSAIDPLYADVKEMTEVRRGTYISYTLPNELTGMIQQGSTPIVEAKAEEATSDEEGEAVPAQAKRVRIIRGSEVVEIPLRNELEEQLIASGAGEQSGLGGSASGLGGSVTNAANALTSIVPAIAGGGN